MGENEEIRKENGTFHCTLFGHPKNHSAWVGIMDVNSRNDIEEVLSMPPSRGGELVIIYGSTPLPLSMLSVLGLYSAFARYDARVYALWFPCPDDPSSISAAREYEEHGARVIADFSGDGLRWDNPVMFCEDSFSTDGNNVAYAGTLPHDYVMDRCVDKLSDRCGSKLRLAVTKMLSRPEISISRGSGAFDLSDLAWLELLSRPLLGDDEVQLLSDAGRHYQFRYTPSDRRASGDGLVPWRTVAKTPQGTVAERAAAKAEAALRIWNVFIRNGLEPACGPAGDDPISAIIAKAAAGSGIASAMEAYANGVPLSDVVAGGVR